MNTARKILAGASTALVLSVASVLAAPLSPLGTATAPVADESLVTKVQAMCRDRWGNWVPCRTLRRPPPPYYAPPPVYRAPPPVYRRPYRDEGRCMVVYNNCIAAYPRGTAPYVSCMRSQGC